jgi:lipopolysaccharide export system permease protein
LIINRYLTREILTPLATTCAILVVIFAGYSTTRYLPAAADGMMTGKTVLILVFLKIIVALEVLIPITLFLSTIMALGRLHAESEIIAMEACGLSERTIFLTVLRISLLVAIIVAGLSLYARPWAYEKSYWLKADAKINFDFSRLRPGRFHEIGRSKDVIFLEKFDEQNKRAEGVFIQQDDGVNRKITHAREARQEISPDTGRKIVVLYDGYHYNLKENGGKSQVIHFQNFHLSLTPKPIDSMKYRQKSASTLSLAASTAKSDNAEFQWRISTGFSTILLGLLGIPFGRTAPRQGKYAKTFVAILVFAFYYNMTVIAKTWMEQGLIGSFPGIWWPQMILVTLLLFLLKRKT